MIPATCLLSSRLNEGAKGARMTVDVVTAPAAVVITTGTLPVFVSAGTCRLICVGLTYQRNAGSPSIVTLVPPRDVGKLPGIHVVVPMARLAPKIEAHSPGWTVEM